MTRVTATRGQLRSFTTLPLQANRQSRCLWSPGNGTITGSAAWQIISSSEIIWPLFSFSTGHKNGTHNNWEPWWDDDGEDQTTSLLSRNLTSRQALQNVVVPKWVIVVVCHILFKPKTAEALLTDYSTSWLVFSHFFWPLHLGNLLSRCWLS